MSSRAVLIVGSNSLFCKGLASLLGRQGEIEIIATARSQSSMLKHIRKSQPDVILVDRNQEGIQPAELLPAILRADPDARVIFVTLSGQEITIYGKQRLDNATAEDLISAVRQRSDE